MFVQAKWLHLGLVYVLGERRLEDSVSDQEGNLSMLKDIISENAPKRLLNFYFS